MKWTRSYRPFVLVSHLRSGTHMLRPALDSHPQVRCQAEPFNANSKGLPYPLDTSTRDILDRWVFPSLSEEIHSVGFVLHTYHPGGLRAFPELRDNPRWDDIWTVLADLPELRVIRLARRNLLRRHLSQILARQSGYWHAWRGERVTETLHLEGSPPSHTVDTERAAQPPVVLDIERLIADFEQIEILRGRVDESLGRHPTHSIVYEEMCGDAAGTFASAQGFLGVPVVEIEPATRKLPERPLDGSIANFDEVAARLRTTRWAYVLDDE